MTSQYRSGLGGASRNAPSVQGGRLLRRAAHGRVRRAKLGVTVQPVTADVASALKLAEIRGALVNSVEPDSPGARAGLQAGDVILEVQGRNVADGNDLRNAVSSSEPGTSITLQIVRDGKPLSIAAKVVELQ